MAPERVTPVEPGDGWAGARELDVRRSLCRAALVLVACKVVVPRKLADERARKPLAARLPDAQPNIGGTAG